MSNIILYFFVYFLSLLSVVGLLINIYLKIFHCIYLPSNQYIWFRNYKNAYTNWFGYNSCEEPKVD
jgi:hypothetical protein